MPTACNASSQHVQFILNGFPGLYTWQHWLFFPFLFMLVLAFLGNISVILIITRERCLHEPMYIFFSILAAIDLVSAITLLPELLAILWHGSNSIPFDVCFAQMYFAYFPTAMESSLLVLMAYDRYVAVCRPLEYYSVVTNQFIIKGSIFIIIRSFFVVMPLAVIARMLTYNSISIVSNGFCEYFSVINTACAQTVMSDNYIIICLFLVVPSDLILTVLSYYKIATISVKLRSKDAQRKIFSTCSSHLFVILFFYLLGTMHILTFLFESVFPVYTHSLVSVLYITTPPVLNPLIYGMKSKEIRLVGTIFAISHPYIMITNIVITPRTS
ncbi:olfactory receptor 56A4-like [Protopterus annectens]|uniref:olfactory receptor 56A4-like n=1 Tax=Protopterus annectens TaxID=7888 RepID=UPI001CF99FA6|nr:olfactory receptor 56A4-like [Protopterus annectens]